MRLFRKAQRKTQPLKNNRRFESLEQREMFAVDLGGMTPALADLAPPINEPPAAIQTPQPTRESDSGSTTSSAEAGAEAIRAYLSDGYLRIIGTDNPNIRDQVMVERHNS